MANRMQAIAEYRPRLERVTTMGMDELCEYIAGRTGLNKGEIRNILEEFNEAIIFQNRQGIWLNIEGLGVFRASRRLDGGIMVNLRIDRNILNEMNKEGAYIGPQVNQAHVGMSVDDLIELWNGDHPDDPVED
ncbi:MAG: hypothetical protein PVJ07_00355 [Anaerolineales bacterium]